MQVFKVNQWMNKNVVTIQKHNTAFEAAELMKKNNIGCIVVTEDGEPIGLISERDLIRKVIAKRQNPDQIIAEDIMSSRVISVESNMDIKEVSSRMVQYNIKKLPVVENGKLQGIVTSTDIVKIMAQFNKLYDAKEIIELGG